MLQRNDGIRPGLWETIAMPDLTLIATVTIFIATYAVVAVGKIPVYRIARRRGVARWQPHAGHRRADSAGGLPCDRFRHHHAAARHDDRRGQPAGLRLLPPGHGLDRDACPPAATAGGHRAGIRHAFGL